MRKSIWLKLSGSFFKLIFPALFVIVLAALAGSIWLVHLASAEPPRADYLVTPERFTQFTANGAQFTDETWANKDNTNSRGWLVRGNMGAPAVVLLHRYGADRSWLLNMGVRMNQATGFTVLIPDLRGHGVNPAVKQSSFGSCEANDLSGAVEYLRGLKGEGDAKLVGQKIGVYGVEVGAIAATLGAGGQPDIAALALDSIPSTPSAVLDSVVGARASFASAAVTPLVNNAAPLYFIKDGCYKDEPLCDSARKLSNRKVLLMAGSDAPEWQKSTTTLASCFGGNAQKQMNLQPSGYNLIKSATSEQQEAYYNIVIEFFRNSLS
jgi:pimeloyl-ACP methyl ester carboxylesterase